MHFRRKRKGPRKKYSKAKRRRMKLGALLPLLPVAELMEKFAAEGVFANAMFSGSPSPLFLEPEASTKEEIKAAYETVGALFHKVPMATTLKIVSPEIVVSMADQLGDSALLKHFYGVKLPLRPHRPCGCRKCVLAGRYPYWRWN